MTRKHRQRLFFFAAVLLIAIVVKVLNEPAPSTEYVSPNRIYTLRAWVNRLYSDGDGTFNCLAFVIVISTPPRRRQYRIFPDRRIHYSSANGCSGDACVALRRSRKSSAPSMLRIIREEPWSLIASMYPSTSHLPEKTA